MDLRDFLVNADADTTEQTARNAVTNLFGSDRPYPILAARFLMGAITNKDIPTMEDFEGFVQRIFNDPEQRVMLDGYSDES